jgi:hypothetical protein
MQAYRTFTIRGALAASLPALFSSITPSTLRCEIRDDPRGIDVAKPRLAWMLDAGQQTAYQIEVAGVCDSGKVGDDLLAPGWSNYRKVCLFDTFDLTKQLRDGANELRVMLGNGFLNIPRGRYVKLQTSFGQPMLTLQMRVRFTDGTEQTIVTYRPAA